MRPNIIRATLAWAAFLCIGYAVLIQLWHPTLFKAPTTGLTNRLFVETYVYGAPAPNVLVGSSLTQRLPADALGPAFINLALSGGNALTGLAIVVKSPYAPRRVLIEINEIDEGLDNNLLDITLTEPTFSARRYVVALRKSYQPMSFLYGLLRGRIGGNDANEEPALNPTQKRDVMTASARSMMTKLDARAMAQDVATLQSLTAQARARGIEPVLYEMPIEPSLTNLPRPSQIREAVRAAFPAGSICWLVVALPGGAHTFDGQHLVSKDAARAAALFASTPACAR